GVVVLLDRRVMEKTYGRYLLESLPPAPLRVGRWGELREDVRRFYAMRAEEWPVEAWGRPRRGRGVAAGAVGNYHVGMTDSRVFGAMEPKPSKIVCVGRNYVGHARELGNDVPERPLIFLKPPSSLCGPGDAIRLPAVSSRVEHEAEIGVVIGRRAKAVRAEDALEVVAGYVALNDVTARDLQRMDDQWTRAKG